MFIKKAAIFVSCLGLCLGYAKSASSFTTNVVITADNAYGFGFGTDSGITTYCGGLRNVLAGDIFFNPVTDVDCSGLPSPYTLPGAGAERYSLDVNNSDYVYIVAWSDNAVTQGVLAGFEVFDEFLVSGSETWEVFATGINKSSSVVTDTLTAADLPDINQQITIANSNSGSSTSSVGWVGTTGGDAGTVGVLALGNFNVNGGGLPSAPVEVPGITTDARWMWYDADPTDGNDPFSGASEREYLIFRNQIQDITENLPRTPEPSNRLMILIGFVGMLVQVIGRLWTKSDR